MESIAPSTEEVQLIALLRGKVKDCLYDDYSRSDTFLVRFIRVRDGNLDGAEKMIRATSLWRRQNSIDQILSKPMSEFCTTNFPLKIEGRDRAGQPLTVPVGLWDLHKASGDEIRFEQFRIYCIQIYEKIIAEIQRCDAECDSSSPPIMQYTVIYDWEGFAFKPLLSLTVDKHLSQIISLVEANYPETIGNCIYINCPAMISSVLSIIKPVMNAKTFAKIKWFKKEDEKWKDYVLQVVDPSQLTPQFGGTKST